MRIFLCLQFFTTFLWAATAIEQATALVEKEHYDQAKEILLQYLQKHPNDSEAKEILENIKEILAIEGGKDKRAKVIAEKKPISKTTPMPIAFGFQPPIYAPPAQPPSSGGNLPTAPPKGPSSGGNLPTAPPKGHMPSPDYPKVKQRNQPVGSLFSKSSYSFAVMIDTGFYQSNAVPKVDSAMALSGIRIEGEVKIHKSFFAGLRLKGHAIPLIGQDYVSYSAYEANLFGGKAFTLMGETSLSIGGFYRYFGLHNKKTKGVYGIKTAYGPGVEIAVVDPLWNRFIFKGFSFQRNLRYRLGLRSQITGTDSMAPKVFGLFFETYYRIRRFDITAGFRYRLLRNELFLESEKAIYAGMVFLKR